MSDKLTDAQIVNLRKSAYVHGTPPVFGDRITSALDELQSLRAENATLLERINADGHKQPCYYCGKPTNDLSANPSDWSVPLCHSDEPGVVKWHHTGCVSERLAENATLRAHLRTCVAALSGISTVADRHEDSDYERLAEALLIADSALTPEVQAAAKEGRG
jgi:hypothetical protein